MRRFFAAVLAILLVTAVPVMGVGSGVPDPTDFFYVNDFANVLSTELRGHIVSVNDDLYARTGAQVVVTTMEFTGGADIADVAFDMFNRWGIGSAERNNGLLMLLVTAQDEAWFLPGAGLEGRIPFNDILEDNFWTYFDDGNFEQAVRLTFDELTSQIGWLYADDINPAPTPAPAAHVAPIAGAVAAQQNNTGGGFWDSVRFFLVIIFVLLILSMFFRAPMMRRRRGFMGPMRPRGMGGFFWGFGMGRAMRPRHPRPPMNRPSGGMGTPPGAGPRAGGGGYSSGGGFTRGLGGGGRPGGGLGGRPSGGPRIGGGGYTRGGGFGRR